MTATSRRTFLASTLALAGTAAVRAKSPPASPPDDFPEPVLTRHDRTRLVTLLIALEVLRRVADHVVGARGAGNDNLYVAALALRTSAEKLHLTFDSDVGTDDDLRDAEREMGLPLPRRERTIDAAAERYPGEPWLKEYFTQESERIASAAECHAARLLLTALLAARHGIEWAATLPEESLYESAARDLDGFREIFRLYFDLEIQSVAPSVAHAVSRAIGIPPEDAPLARLPMRKVREAAVRAAREILI